MRNTTKTAEGAAARVPGGASGMPTPQGAIAPPVSPAAASFLGRGPGPRPKKYRVLNGGMVMFNNSRTPLRAGKEVSEQHYNIAELKKQGIRLEEIVDEQAAPIPELEAPAVEG